MRATIAPTIPACTVATIDTEHPELYDAAWLLDMAKSHSNQEMARLLGCQEQDVKSALWRASIVRTKHGQVQFSPDRWWGRAGPSSERVIEVTVTCPVCGWWEFVEATRWPDGWRVERHAKLARIEGVLYHRACQDRAVPVRVRGLPQG